MSTSTALQLSPFAADVQAGLVEASRKKLSPTYLYDDLGSKLFEAITVLPEYGCTRADERILARCSPQIAAQMRSRAAVAELGSGCGRKTSHILSAIGSHLAGYFPIDVSNEALSACCRELAPLRRSRLSMATILRDSNNWPSRGPNTPICFCFSSAARSGTSNVWNRLNSFEVFERRFVRATCSCWAPIW